MEFFSANLHRSLRPAFLGIWLKLCWNFRGWRLHIFFVNFSGYEKSGIQYELKFQTAIIKNDRTKAIKFLRNFPPSSKTPFFMTLFELWVRKNGNIRVIFFLENYLKIDSFFDIWIPKCKNYSGVRITDQGRIFTQILPIFFCQIWLSSSSQKIPGLMSQNICFACEGNVGLLLEKG